MAQQGLHISQRMAQQQVLSPQMQQSLQMLQAPMLELKALIEQELQQNPVLEEVAVMEAASEEKPADREAAEKADLAEPPADVKVDPMEEHRDEPVDDFQAEFEKLAQIDQEWRDHLSTGQSVQRASEEDEERRQFMFDSLTAGPSLHEYLLEQVRQSDLAPAAQSIAESIVGNIDDHGYLKATSEEIAHIAQQPLEAVEPVLKIIQSFHPAGIGARDLQECLRLQLERANRQETLEYRIVVDYMEALGRRRFPEIARGLDVEIDEIQDAVEEIGKLDPRPGRAFTTEQQQYVVPEITVRANEGGFAVTSNSDQVPHLRISNAYKDLMAQAQSSPEVREYIRSKIRDGKFLIKSLHQRQETILNIGKEIVRRQHDFFAKGKTHMKPLTMSQVAEVVGVHETTVSRAVSGKYMDTPHGVYEMRYFFTAGLKTASGQDMSNASVKEMISELVKQEDPSSPLSDEAIVKILTEKGVVIARRTVAKYRGELNILPSNMRRVY
jgi:RNA polymerase sigma-54 factor